MRQEKVVIFFLIFSIILFLSYSVFPQDKEGEKKEKRLLLLPPAWYLAQAKLAMVEKGEIALSLSYIHDYSEGFSGHFYLASLKKPPEIKVGGMRLIFSAQVNRIGTGSPWIDLVVGPSFSMSFDPVLRKFWWE
jgi:hypothetical protein